MSTGDYNVICDRSGFKVKRSQCVLEWNGMLVYEPFAEQRHPMDHFKAPQEPRKYLHTRPEQEIVEVDNTLAPDWDSL
jgi:hypothetical protein